MWRAWHWLAGFYPPIQGASFVLSKAVDRLHAKGATVSRAALRSRCSGARVLFAPAMRPRRALALRTWGAPEGHSQLARGWTSRTDVHLLLLLLVVVVIIVGGHALEAAALAAAVWPAPPSAPRISTGRTPHEHDEGDGAHQEEADHCSKQPDEQAGQPIGWWCKRWW